MKFRPSFEYFPYNAEENKPEYVFRVNIQLEDGATFAVLNLWKTADPMGGIDTEDFAANLEVVAKAIRKFGAMVDEVALKKAFPGLDAPLPEPDPTRKYDA